jgi:AcrR family transcriptional regulator
MARRVPRGQETRERILAEALRLFAAHGFARVSVEEIADAAGVTKGAVYHWFTDKDDLGRELQHELYERLSAVSLSALDPHGDTIENMRRSFGAYLDALGDLDEARFFLRDAWVIPALDEGGRSDHEDAIEMVRDILAVAVEEVLLDGDALFDHKIVGNEIVARRIGILAAENEHDAAWGEFGGRLLRSGAAPLGRSTGGQCSDIFFSGWDREEFWTKLASMSCGYPICIACFRRPGSSTFTAMAATMSAR